MLDHELEGLSIVKILQWTKSDTVYIIALLYDGLLNGRKFSSLLD